MLKDLIKLANTLDAKGFCGEADRLDFVIRRLAHGMMEGTIVDILEDPKEPSGCESNLEDEVYYFDNLSNAYYKKKEEDEAESVTDN